MASKVRHLQGKLAAFKQLAKSKGILYFITNTGQIFLLDENGDEKEYGRFTSVGSQDPTSDLVLPDNSLYINTSNCTLHVSTMTGDSCSWSLVGSLISSKVFYEGESLTQGHIFDEDFTKYRLYKVTVRTGESRITEVVCTFSVSNGNRILSGSAPDILTDSELNSLETDSPEYEGKDYQAFADVRVLVSYDGSTGATPHVYRTAQSFGLPTSATFCNGVITKIEGIGKIES